jgi:hypothetical protein
MTIGDPRVLPAGERIRESWRADPRRQHGQQVFPPGVGQPGTGEFDLPSPCRFHQTSFEGVRGPAGEARGRAAGNVPHRSGRASPGLHGAGPDRGKEHRRDPAARFRAFDREAVPRRLASRRPIFTADPEKHRAMKDGYRIGVFRGTGSSSSTSGPSRHFSPREAIPFPSGCPPAGFSLFRGNEK